MVNNDKPTTSNNHEKGKFSIITKKAKPTTSYNHEKGKFSIETKKAKPMTMNQMENKLKEHEVYIYIYIYFINQQILIKPFFKG